LQYHIDTIPVWDAIKLGGECPLCALQQKIEQMDVERFLGASVMEPDVRIRVNAKGFCSHHLSLLFAQKNRLGLALMLHTHMKETEKKAEAILSQAKLAALRQTGQPVLQRMMKRGGDSSAPLHKSAQELQEAVSSCVICDSLQDHMNRYCYTFLYLWERDRDFRKAVSGSKGICIPHGAKLLSMAEENLPARELGSFTETLSGLIMGSLHRIGEDVEWFTQKFDYRNQDKPWGESRNAVERACNQLRGWCVGEGPWDEKAKEK
jgi:hypothetical protein